MVQNYANKHANLPENQCKRIMWYRGGWIAHSAKGPGIDMIRVDAAPRYLRVFKYGFRS